MTALAGATTGTPTGSTGELHLATFWLAGQLHGIDVAHVQEVLRHPGLARVPLAPSPVAGLVNLRGQVVTALDLRQLLQLPPREARGDDAGGVLIVVRDPRGPVGLLVDGIADVVRAPLADVEPPPDTLTGPRRDLLRAVCTLPDRLLLVLDAERVTRG